jgi:dynein heavy chain
MLPSLFSGASSQNGRDSADAVTSFGCAVTNANGCTFGAAMQVTEMKKVVEQKQVVVAQAKTDCEELLVQIVQDKRVADEQEKQVRPCLRQLENSCWAVSSHCRWAATEVGSQCSGVLGQINVDFHAYKLQVNAEATKIAKETEEANVIANQVSAELEKALPALQEAEAALNVLTKKDISELKVREKHSRLLQAPPL